MSNCVTFFPCVDNLAPNPYWAQLMSSLEKIGIRYSNESNNSFGRRWLFTNRGKVNILHLHYIQQFYAYEIEYARLRWVLRFARNLLLARALGYYTVFTVHNMTPTYPLRPVWVDYFGHWVAVNLTHSIIVHCCKAKELLEKTYQRQKKYMLSHILIISMFIRIIFQLLMQEIGWE
jgi:beta-1,4-mannosyltransferase